MYCTSKLRNSSLTNNGLVEKEVIMLHAKRKELQAEVKTAKALYIKHQDDKTLQTMLSNAIKLYIAKGEVVALNSCLCTWDAGSSTHKFATVFIKDHCNAKQVKSERGAKKFVAHSKPAKKDTMGRKQWFTPLRSECQDKQDATATRKATYLYDTPTEMAKFVTRNDRYTKDGRNTDNERAKAAQAIIHAAQAKIMALYAI
jgi:hypothetical protein